MKDDSVSSERQLFYSVICKPRLHSPLCRDLWLKIESSEDPGEQRNDDSGICSSAVGEKAPQWVAIWFSKVLSWHFKQMLLILGYIGFRVCFYLMYTFVFVYGCIKNIMLGAYMLYLIILLST